MDFWMFVEWMGFKNVEELQDFVTNPLNKKYWIAKK